MSGSNIPRLAICHEGNDVARIIPSRLDDGKLDIKIVFPQYEFEVFSYPLMNINPIITLMEGDENASITYHHGAGGRDVVVHIKRGYSEGNEHQYASLPLKHIVAPNTDTIMPLPLLKIELPLCHVDSRPSKRKRGGKTVFNMDPECTCVEVFMMSPDMGIGNVFEKFPTLLELLVTLPFEGWASCSMANMESKREVVPHGEAKPCISEMKVGDVIFLLLQYPEPAIPRLLKRMRATFIDNELSEAMMLHSTVAYHDGLDSYMVRLPELDDLHFPPEMLLLNRRRHYLLLDAIRVGTITSSEYERIRFRVSDGCLSLFAAIREREERRSRDIEELELRAANLEELANYEVPRRVTSTLGRQLWIARKLDSGPALLHVTTYVNQMLGIKGEHAFITFSNDVDLHFDIERVCSHASISPIPRAHLTEGRPFSDGFAGLRTALTIRGFACGNTTTHLIPAGESDHIVELYTAPKPVSMFENPAEERGREVLETSGESEAEFLRTLLSRGPHEAGTFLYDLCYEEPETDGSLECPDGREVGRVDLEEWSSLKDAILRIVEPYGSALGCFDSLKKGVEELEQACSGAWVKAELSRGVERTDVLALANVRATKVTSAYRHFLASLRPLASSYGDFDDCMRRFLPSSLDQRVGRLWEDLHPVLLNVLPFTTISETAGVGPWLTCSIERILSSREASSLSEDSRELLEEIEGDAFDLSASARELLAYAESGLALGAVLHYEEALDVAKDCYEFVSRAGVKHLPACVRFPEEGRTDAVVSLDPMPLPQLGQFLDDTRHLAITTGMQSRFEELRGHLGVGAGE